MGDFCEDCGKSVDGEPAPVWRELGPNEVIQEGDETRAWGSQEWFTTAGEYYLGRPAHAFRPNLFRTRRPPENWDGCE